MTTKIKSSETTVAVVKSESKKPSSKPTITNANRSNSAKSNAAAKKTNPKKTTSKKKPDAKKTVAKKEPHYDVTEHVNAKGKVHEHANGAAFTDKRPGVIATIIELLKNATSKKPVTKDAMLKTLTKRFPDRGEDKMKATLSMQVPAGLRTEKGLEVSKNENGYWL